MTDPPIASRRRLRALVALACVAVAGCSGHETTILESDVALPPDMQVRVSTDPKRESGTLVGGRFLLSGRVPDIAKTDKTTTERYTTNGWKEESRETWPDRIVTVYSKGNRTCRVEIDRRRVDPVMSHGVVEVSATP